MRVRKQRGRGAPDPPLAQRCSRGRQPRTVTHGRVHGFEALSRLVEVVAGDAVAPGEGSAAFRASDRVGADVRADEFGKPYVTVDHPRMLRLVKNPDFEQHTLVLSVPDKGTRAYAFTFVSCPSKDTALA